MDGLIPYFSIEQCSIFKKSLINSVFSSSGLTEGVAEFETEDLLSEFLLEFIKSASSMVLLFILITY